jgi:formate dehydrogenase subunit delta
VDTDKMVHRVNEIARFWEAYPHDEAVAGVAEHIRKFWEPRFRRQLVEYARGGGAGLRPLAAEAIEAVQISQSS